MKTPPFDRRLARGAAWLLLAGLAACSSLPDDVNPRARTAGRVAHACPNPQHPGATPDKIVLLPDPDGKVGKVFVRSATGSQNLAEAYASVSVAGDGGIQQAAGNAADVDARYGRLLAALPPRPTTYTVHFAFDSATELTPDSMATIDQLKTALAAWPAPRIVVVGHTDAAGSPEFNDKLSVRRAEAVAEILVRNGIPAQRIEILGRGKRELAVATADGVRMAENRRVVISVQ